jgi:hypothetical protein
MSSYENCSLIFRVSISSRSVRGEAFFTTNRLVYLELVPRPVLNPALVREALIIRGGQSLVPERAL